MTNGMYVMPKDENYLYILVLWIYECIQINKHTQINLWYSIIQLWLMHGDGTLWPYGIAIFPRQGFRNKVHKALLAPYYLIKTTFATSSATTRYKYKISPGSGLVSTEGLVKVFFKDSNASSQSVVYSKLFVSLTIYKNAGCVVHIFKWICSR